MNALATPRCTSCNRRILNGDSWQDEMHVDCGGICRGCDVVAKGYAVFRDCTFHGYQCVVRNHYADSTHLCSDDYCIEHQDITTLMLNASWARYEEGEGNELFDRLLESAARAETGRTFYPLDELTPDELERWLDGDKSLQPDDCTTICMSGLSREQFIRQLNGDRS